MLEELVYKWWWDKGTSFSRVRCVCVTMPGEGGVSEGRDLIRCVRMGVCVWVQGVYLVKSSVGRRRWGFIKMNQPLPVSLSLTLSLTQHKTRMAPCCGLSKRQFNKLTHSHISSHTHEVSITNVGKTGKCILLWINETLLCRYISELSLRKSNLVVFNLCLNPSAHLWPRSG